ncbi:AraC family transcriptional regulator [Bermanella marisrubri]|uniref:Transcriptional regulator, AraC family protein n=1 Tax=Bermanella marisrubri TaxID=207949 RepID=Q1N3G2_9GAMM|nr:AraC family transcriptional regulator [Bermanella marisrubri]EAT12629.1 transcriptional regulator, AraC family protein [Oceanobacter sp. RED65] [Bermanella marisrubri]QIZ85244.1 AraC family transcriptional regulator [Bermanella marisrubri]
MLVTRQQYHERTHKVHLAQGQLLLLLDIIRIRKGKASLNTVLHGTGLFYEDLLKPETLISAEQILCCMKNAKRLFANDELAFLLGHRLWPGHYSQAAPLLSFCENLRQLVNVFENYGAELSPLLQPRFYWDEHYFYVQWIDAYGCDDLKPFLVSAHMSGLISCIRHLSQTHWPWTCFLSCKGNSQLDPLMTVHLGDFRTQAPLDVMRLPIRYLSQAFASASPSLFHAHQANVRSTIQPGLLYTIYDVLANNIDKELSLNDLADCFAMSSATLKRKLKTHQTQFKHLDGLSKLSVALYLFKEKEWENQKVASFLKYKDTANFRRAFKRWCGLTPSQFKQT